MRRFAIFIIGLYLLAAGLLAAWLGFVGWALGAQNGPLLAIPAVIVIVGAIGLWSAKDWGWWIAVIANFSILALIAFNLAQTGGELPPNGRLVHVAGLGWTALVIIFLMLPRTRARHAPPSSSSASQTDA